ncbi:hypothetical protein DAEQUDRAFT_708446 [Daedalea quercina L-15889]|uniref:GST N-terminal domain-containing protein n=1 Tax=Daedalea quercina L-15889 TaxID=1314783 RepID=A0A165R873_9APHY|nr:hypothetical protein DAEQUDRAFT_708446 [Daedalea quercina L-15889]
MSAPSQRAIKLFDLRSNLSPQAWSLHAWRTRLVLNYKKLPYTTEWVAMPDLRTVIPAVGGPPTQENDPKYSVPVIIDAIADPPVVLSDSTIIADYLEKTYPEPTIYPHGKESQMRYTAAIVDHVIMQMVFLVVPTAPKILSERDAEYFIATRKLVFGFDVQDIVARGPEEEAGWWQGLEDGLSRLSALTDEIDHGERWLFGTAQGPGYADFVLVAALYAFKVAVPEGSWERIKRLNGGKWGKHLDNAREFMEVL